MAESRARGFAGAAALAGAGEGGRVWPVTGFGGGGGAGRGATGGRDGTAARGGGTDFAGAGFGGAPAVGGTPVAPSGVPHRAQNLNVAAFNVMQFGHCFGGAPCARRGALAGPFAAAADGVRAIVGSPSSSPKEAPHEEQRPTSFRCARRSGDNPWNRFYDARQRRVKAATFGGLSRLGRSPAL